MKINKYDNERAKNVENINKENGQMKKDFTKEECEAWMKVERNRRFCFHLSQIIDDCYDEKFEEIMDVGRNALSDIIEKNNLKEVLESSCIDDTSMESCLFEIYEYLFNAFCDRLPYNQIYKWIDEKAFQAADIDILAQTMADYRINKNSDVYVPWFNLQLLNQVLDIKEFQEFVLKETKKHFKKMVYKSYKVGHPLVNDYAPAKSILKDKCCNCGLKACIHNPNSSHYSYLTALLQCLKINKEGPHIYNKCPYVLESVVLAEDSATDKNGGAK